MILDLRACTKKKFWYQKELKLFKKFVTTLSVLEELYCAPIFCSIINHWKKQVCFSRNTGNELQSNDNIKFERLLLQTDASTNQQLLKVYIELCRDIFREKLRMEDVLLIYFE